MFSVEKAICLSVSTESLMPTDRGRDRYLKIERMKDLIKRKRGKTGKKRKKKI